MSIRIIVSLTPGCLAAVQGATRQSPSADVSRSFSRARSGTPTINSKDEDETLVQTWADLCVKEKDRYQEENPHRHLEQQHSEKCPCRRLRLPPVSNICQPPRDRLLLSSFGSVASIALAIIRTSLRTPSLSPSCVSNHKPHAQPHQRFCLSQTLAQSSNLHSLLLRNGLGTRRPSLTTPRSRTPGEATLEQRLEGHL